MLIDSPEALDADSALLGAALPALRFAADPSWPESAALYTYLRQGQARSALQEARALLAAAPEAGRAAALCCCCAAAELMLGGADGCRRHAAASLGHAPGQWTAHRLTAEAYAAQGLYSRAYAALQAAPPPAAAQPWEEPVPASEIHLYLANLCLRSGDVRRAFEHLSAAFPEGAPYAPAALHPDWFRLGLNLDHAAEATAAARLLAARVPVQTLDDLSQAILQRGWLPEALEVYEMAALKHPESALVRRRLVGLYIRTGNVDRARAILRPQALEITA